MIGDGVIPSNNGRGYVLRRLIRRACRHGRLLGVNEPFLYKVCDTVIHENHVAYPELADKAELITKVIHAEEDSFGKTIDAGLAMLDEYINKLDGNVFSGEDAFKLNDTYGFPLDLTKDILEEKGITVDEDKFNALLAAQRRQPVLLVRMQVLTLGRAIQLRLTLIGLNLWAILILIATQRF